MTTAASRATAPGRSFAAMRNGGFRMHFATFFVAMMADNIEHVISYWMMWQKFHPPVLGGFAVISHGCPTCCSRSRRARSATASTRAA